MTPTLAPHPNIKVNRVYIFGKEIHVHVFDILHSSSHRNELDDSSASMRWGGSKPVYCSQQLCTYQPKLHEELLEVGKLKWSAEHVCLF